MLHSLKPNLFLKKKKRKPEKAHAQRTGERKEASEEKKRKNKNPWRAAGQQFSSWKPGTRLMMMAADVFPDRNGTSPPAGSPTHPCALTVRFPPACPRRVGVVADSARGVWLRGHRHR